MFYWLVQLFKMTQFRMTFNLELIEMGIGGKSLGNLWSNLKKLGISFFIVEKKSVVIILRST